MAIHSNSQNGEVGASNDVTTESLARALSRDTPISDAEPYLVPCVICQPYSDDSAAYLPKLAISTGKNGKPTFKGHGDCTLVMIRKEIAKRGLLTSSKTKEKIITDFKPWEHTPVEVYKYQHADRSAAYEKRLYSVNGKIRTKFWHKDAKGGWQRGTDPLIYNLPEIAHQASIGELVACVENETDVETLKEWDFPAFCLDDGSNSDWHQRYADDLNGITEIYFVPKNDEQGYRFANLGCELFTAAGIICHWVELPGIEALGLGATLKDWKEFGHPHSEFVDAVIKASTTIWTQEVPCPEHLIEVEKPDEPAAGNPPNGKEKGRANDPVCLLWTDMTLGEYFATQHSENVRYAESEGWYCWDGRRFRSDLDGVRVRLLAEKTASWTTKLIRGTPMDQKSQSSGLQKVQSNSGINNMLMAARSKPGILCHSDDFDKSPYILNTASGAINLRDGSISEHDRALMCAKLINPAVKYDLSCGEALKNSRFIQFMVEIFGGDWTMIEFMQRALGYSLTGDTKEQKIFFCHGSGRNGKSVLLDLVMHILGDYATASQPEMWMQRQNRDHAESFVQLIGKRFVTAGEVKENDKLEEGRIKNFSGGDLLKTRRLRHDETIEFRPVGKIWMFGNNKPAITDHTYSIWSRVLLIPFNEQFNNPDRDLLQKLKKEASLVLFWLVCGAISALEEGLAPPEQIERATAEYKAEQDTPEQFVSTCFEKDGEEFLVRQPAGEIATECFEVYKKYCEETGRRYPKTLIAFGIMMKRFKITDRKFNDGSHYALCIKPEWRPPETNVGTRYQNKRGRPYDPQLHIAN